MDTMFAQYQLGKLVVFHITFCAHLGSGLQGTWGRTDNIG